MKLRDMPNVPQTDEGSIQAWIYPNRHTGEKESEGKKRTRVRREKRLGKEKGAKVKDRLLSPTIKREMGLINTR